MNAFDRWLVVVSLACLAGCNDRSPASSDAAPPSGASKILLSVTSDPSKDPQSVDMAMKLAGFSLDEERQVVIFFNVKGVTIPTQNFADDFAFQDAKPIKAQLTELIARGVDVHVCPICMKALAVDEADLIEGAKVTTRPSLFENIGPETSVFTY